MSQKPQQNLITAIVVTYNSDAFITSCLKTLIEEMEINDGNILIGDNNSHDSTVKLMESKFPQVEVIKNKKNIGFASAANQLAEMTSAKYLIFVNPDFIIDSGSVKILQDVIEDLPDAGAVTARMRSEEGLFQPTCRKLPNTKNIFFSRGSLLSNISSVNSASYTLGDFNEINDVPAASATCLMIKKSFFEEIGGFDKRFFMFMEDTDLCHRINQAGRKVYFVPGAGGIHFWGRGSSVSLFKRIGYHHISVWKYFLKYFPNGFSLFILPIALFFNFLLCLLKKGWLKGKMG